MVSVLAMHYRDFYFFWVESLQIITTSHKAGQKWDEVLGQPIDQKIFMAVSDVIELSLTTHLTNISQRMIGHMAVGVNPVLSTVGVLKKDQFISPMFGILNLYFQI